MTRPALVLMTIAFALAGGLLFKVVTQSSESTLSACEERCRSEGKVAIVAPTGTAGRSIDGGRNWNEPANFCSCVAPGANVGSSALAK